MRIAAKIWLTKTQCQQLETRTRGRRIEVRLDQRAKMILLAARGKTDKQIGTDTNVWRGTVRPKIVLRLAKSS